MITSRLRSRSALAALMAVLALAPACAVGDETGPTEEEGDGEVDDGLPDLEGPDEWRPEALFTYQDDDIGAVCKYSTDCGGSYGVDWWGRSIWLGDVRRTCVNNRCLLKQSTFHPGACTAHACWPDHWPTAQKRCEETGFSRALGHESWQVAGDRILVGGWGYLNGSVGWHQVEIGGGRAMMRVTCERDSNAPPKPVDVPPPPPPPAAPPPPPPAAPPIPPSGTTVSFKTHLWPRLKSNCASCHSALGSLSSAFNAMTSGSFGSCNGKPGVIAKNAWGSPLYQKVRGTPLCGRSMAGYSNSTLRSILYRWINQGARNN